MKFINIISIILLTILSGCASQEERFMTPLQVVEYVDLKKYTGEWYEIARYPNRFQKDCEGSKATYTLRDDGKVTVLNECYDQGFSSLIKSAKGRAWVVDKETNAKLKVSFFWPFSGDYWIIDLGKEYDYAVIGHPKRKYLWILSRAPQIDEKLYQQILTRITKQKYDISKLIPQREKGE